MEEISKVEDIENDIKYQNNMKRRIKICKLEAPQMFGFIEPFELKDNDQLKQNYRILNAKEELKDIINTEKIIKNFEKINKKIKIIKNERFIIKKEKDENKLEKIKIEIEKNIKESKLRSLKKNMKISENDKFSLGPVNKTSSLNRRQKKLIN